MMSDREVVTLAELRQLLAAESAPKKVTIADDLVSDYALAALVPLRGLTRSDKLRVIRRMQRMLGSQAGARRSK